MSGFYVLNGELYHIGTATSGRYKKGSGKRPFQHTGRAVRIRKARTKKPSFSERRAQKKEAKIKAEQEVKAKQAAEERKKYAEEQERTRQNLNKEWLIREAPASEVIKYKNVLSNDELRSSLDRINTLKKLEEYSAKEMQSAWDKYNAAVKRTKEINEGITAAINFSNNAKLILDMLNKNLQQNQQQGQKKQKSS